MLNISKNTVTKKSASIIIKHRGKYFHRKYHAHFNRFLAAFSIIGIFILFLPWTQNISGRGALTTLKPDQRPQTIQSPIPGRIEKWYVKEGDFVNKGDTILFISEIKHEYFDPQLVARTGKQVTAKSMAVTSYQEKVKTLENQINALIKERILKLRQAETNCNRPG